MVSPFTVFSNAHATTLRAIACSARNGLTVDDLHSEAWIIASKIGNKRGHPVDFSNKDDQELVLQWLQAHLKFSRRGQIRALSIDQSWASDGEEDGTLNWLSRLAAPELSDPLAELLHAESTVDWIALARANYSELSAYILLLVRFYWDRKKLAAFLMISVTSLWIRIDYAVNKMRVQPSLFDGVNAIDADFSPMRRHPRMRWTWGHETHQQSLCF